MAAPGQAAEFVNILFKGGGNLLSRGLLSCGATGGKSAKWVIESATFLRWASQGVWSMNDDIEPYAVVSDKLIDGVGNDGVYVEVGERQR